MRHLFASLLLSVAPLGTLQAVVLTAPTPAADTAAEPAPTGEAAKKSEPSGVNLADTKPFSFKDLFNEGESSEVPCHLY